MGVALLVKWRAIGTLRCVYNDKRSDEREWCAMVQQLEEKTPHQEKAPALMSNNREPDYQ
jgi:hypothetical protein